MNKAANKNEWIDKWGNDDDNKSKDWMMKNNGWRIEMKRIGLKEEKLMIFWILLVEL